MQTNQERKGLARELRAYIAILKILAVVLVLLIGITTLARLDTVMTAQRIHDKTLSDAMDQLMFIRMDLDLIDLQLSDVLAMDKPEIAPHDAYPLTLEERDLIERVVATEARGEPIEGMAAVAQVIRDRSTEWGMTVTEVVTAPGQFAGPYTGEISPGVVQAVWAVFDEGMSVMEVPTTHFHANYVVPYWTSGKVSRGSVGSHRFYY